MVGLMAKRKSIPRKPLSPDDPKPQSEEMQALREQVRHLQFEVDVLKDTLAVLKKDPGVDLTALKNREKAVIIGALREKCALPMLLSYFYMARSSYYYQQTVMHKPDKYLPFRAQITSVFRENRGVYGYRRIHLALKRKGITLSEKVIRHIMKAERLAVFVPQRAKYSSYLGEITPEVDNIISQDFHSKQPYEKLLTDITEFALPDGKLYLSAMIDCFDGMVIGWTIGSHPNADLVNTMLDEVIAQLPDGCYPTVHSDRGCHYRWPGWIERMREAGLTRSMSKKGCSPDNAACEGFFGRLKNEMFYGRSWTGVSPDDFVQKLDDYINWYNRKRSSCPWADSALWNMDSILGSQHDLSNFLSAPPSLRSLDSVSGTKRYAQLMEKLSAGSGTLVPGGAHMLIDLSSWYKTSLPPKIELIQSAIERHRIISFDYFSPGGESARKVEPYYLVFHWSTWYVWGWCRSREDFRLFKLNRMTELRSGEAFEPRTAPLPDLEPERVFPAKYQVCALFDPDCRWRLVEEYGTGCFTEERDGRLRFTDGFPDADSVLSWVLTFGDKAELLEPEELCRKLEALGKTLAERYKGRC